MRALGALALALAAAACGPAPETHAIAIRGMKFVPDHLEVREGDTIVWTNEDILQHNITSVPAKAISSAPLDSHQEFHWDAKTAGHIDYTCTFHPMMKASIDVK